MLIRSIAHWRLAALLLRLAAGRAIRFGCSARPWPRRGPLYQRADGDYNGWGHLWNTADCNGSATETSWTQPLAAAGPEHGALYRIPLSADASCLNLIMHKGDEKDLGGTDRSGASTNSAVASSRSAATRNCPARQ